MGADLSKYESYSLVSYASNPFAILDAAYVHDGLKPLHLTLVPDTRLLSTGEWKIHTGSSADNLLYTTRTNFGRGEVDRATVTVLDSAQGGTPVCTFACDSIHVSRKYTIYHGELGSLAEAMAVKVRAIKGELELQVTIKGSGEVVWVKTTKRGNMIYVFSGYPQLDKEGKEPRSGYLIAKSSIKSSGKMEAQLSVGVDRAAMVALLLLVEFVRIEERKFSVTA